MRHAPHAFFFGFYAATLGTVDVSLPVREHVAAAFAASFCAKIGAALFEIL